MFSDSSRRSAPPGVAPSVVSGSVNRDCAAPAPTHAASDITTGYQTGPALTCDRFGTSGRLTVAPATFEAPTECVATDGFEVISLV